MPLKAKTRKIKKILLILPPRTFIKDKESKRTYPPLGLGYIASLLRDEYDVKIIDTIVEGFYKEVKLDGGLFRYGLTWEEIAYKIIEFSPDLVGISCLQILQSEEAHRICEIVKNIDEDIITVIGGIYPSSLPLFALGDPNVDFLVLGEGEYIFYHLIKSIEKGSSFFKLDGIGFRENGRKIIIPQKEYIRNLDILPLPARALLPLRRYSEICSAPFGGRKTKKVPFTSMITSRGCPMKCSFCCSHLLWGREFRARSAENILDEIEDIVKSGFREIHFFDDNITYNRERAIKIFDGIVERNIDISWYTAEGVAISTLDEELLIKMKRSGCYRVGLPIETANQEVLNRVKKPLDLRRVSGVVRIIKELGMYADGFFMIGFPCEAKENLQKTVDLAMDLGLDYSIFCIVTPFPGTELYDFCREKGYLRKSVSLRDFRFARGNIDTEKISPQYLEEFRKEAWSKVNFSYSLEYK